MKKATITLSYDEEKLSALKLYLEQKGVSVEDELTAAADSMYSKNVPANVREFIDLRSGNAASTVPKPKKMRQQESKPQPELSEQKEVIKHD